MEKGVAAEKEAVAAELAVAEMEAGASAEVTGVAGASAEVTGVAGVATEAEGTRKGHGLTTSEALCRWQRGETRRH